LALLFGLVAKQLKMAETQSRAKPYGWEVKERRAQSLIIPIEVMTPMT
jgi:hypothetical protein